ncbi:UDP-N-acetylglucosamine 2-epimerase [Tunturibacter empetritectus]|uniref:UDP-N-acetylglucosamine 2-epimerase n=1 Tax=Tunturiibacter empetritectus TaxID=3069691 RepID=A0AAU7ZAF1_9BACT
MKRTIAVVTSSRADYSHLYWPLKDLAAHAGVDLKLIVLAAHLSPQFGSTVEEIERDGLPIAARIECLLSSDTGIGMAKTLGLATLGLADALAQLKPDLLLLIADRYEMLAPASVALTLRIPIAHIEGGEISEGAIDDAVRNALTKLAHLHFTSTHTARARVIAMGEEPWRVHRAGAPSLDHLRRSTLLTRNQLEAALGLPLTGPITVVAYHPVTLLPNHTAEAEALFKALEHLALKQQDHQTQQSQSSQQAHQTQRAQQSQQTQRTQQAQEAQQSRQTHQSQHTPGHILFCYPNADAGSYALMDRIHAFCLRHPNARLFVNLPAITYWSLLREATLLLGNSSSGIMEAASFHLPVVNIGLRQHGRERGPNILDAAIPPGDPDPAPILHQIAKATNPAFRQRLLPHENLYGDGHASNRIVEVLTTTPLEHLLHKHAQPLPDPA